MLVLITACVAALVFILGVVGVLLLRSDPLAHLSADDRDLIRAPVKKRSRRNPWTQFGLWLAPYVPAAMGGTYQQFVESRIVYARSEQFATSLDFYAMKARLAVLCGVGGVCIGLVTQSWFLAVLVFIAGFLIPDLSLHAAGNRRQQQIEDALPDFLDILAVTVSAGLSFRGALERVIDRTEGPLAEEMRLVMRKMDVGSSRHEAFSTLKHRTKSQAMEAFVTSLLQSEELGAPLVDSLDQIATDLRRMRAQSSRQDASKASPKIATVVTLVMVPGTMVLLMVSMYFSADIDFGALFGGEEGL